MVLTKPKPSGSDHRREVLRAAATVSAAGAVFGVLCLAAARVLWPGGWGAGGGGPCLFARPIPPFKHRDDLGALLEAEGFTVGVELGVQRGRFARTTLRRWRSARVYVLVDVWGQQAQYRDAANQADRVHAQFKRDALAATAEFRARGTDVRVCHARTSDCVGRFADGFFDYQYVDARHDRKSVAEDLAAWWPKLRPGGIMAGHDYVTNDDGPLRTGQDWSVNYDGTRDPSGGAVKAAVDDFAASKGLQVVVSYREGAWNTWALRKPVLA